MTMSKPHKLFKQQNTAQFPASIIGSHSVILSLRYYMTSRKPFPLKQCACKIISTFPHIMELNGHTPNKQQAGTFCDLHIKYITRGFRDSSVLTLTELEMPSGRTKTSWLQWKGATWSGTGTSHDHLDCGQDYPTGSSSRRETKRQTEETMGRQHQGVDWPWMEYTTTESWEPRGVEEAGCKIYSGARTVRQTTG